MADDYNQNTSTNELRKDVHEAHSDSKVAKLLSTLALLGAVVALTLSIMALDKAGEAQSTANRASDAIERMQ
ncbi:MAG: hypothetical protein JWO54_206 [Candidatus Saccharibacteria bacterium]|nr:hypothetical protein [Candidatus Saccharibacteria bacterium]